jgi:hypothetical protein
VQHELAFAEPARPFRLVLIGEVDVGETRQVQRRVLGHAGGRLIVIGWLALTGLRCGRGSRRRVSHAGGALSLSRREVRRREPGRQRKRHADGGGVAEGRCHSNGGHIIGLSGGFQGSEKAGRRDP